MAAGEDGQVLDDIGGRLLGHQLKTDFLGISAVHTRRCRVTYE